MKVANTSSLHICVNMYPNRPMLHLQIEPYSLLRFQMKFKISKKIKINQTDSEVNL